MHMKKLFYILTALAVLVFANGCNVTIQEFYVPNPNWHVDYGGRETDIHGNWYDYVNVRVTAGNGDYLVGWVTVDEFNEWGIEGAVDYWLEIYNSDGYFQDYVVSGSDRVMFMNDMNTDLPCVAFAFAVYSWGEPTGSYAVSRSFYPGEPR